jgi:hypothetical protein
VLPERFEAEEIRRHIDLGHERMRIEDAVDRDF